MQFIREQQQKENLRCYKVTDFVSEYDLHFATLLIVLKWQSYIFM